MHITAVALGTVFALAAGTVAQDPAGRQDAFRLVRAGDAEGLRALLAAHPEQRDAEEPDHGLPLHVAADLGMLACVEALLDAGSDVAATAYNRFTPLHLAAVRGRLEVVRLLVRRGAPLDAPSAAGTPLQMAAKSRAREVVLWLRNAGARYDLPTAVSMQDLQWAQKLLADDPDLRVARATLAEAASTGQTELLRLLLPREEAPSAFDFGAVKAPLTWNAIRHRDTLAMLLDEGELLDFRFQPRLAQPGGTLLHVAAKADAAASIELLLDRGLHVDVTDDSGWTPLQEAVRHTSANAVETLLRRGAKAHRGPDAALDALSFAVAPIDAGTTSEDLAAARRIVDLLLADGMQPRLEAAVALDMQDRVRELLAAGASVDAYTGPTLLGRAVRMGHFDIARQLIAAGARIDGTDRSSCTPLHWAACWDRVDGIDLLHEHGAALDPRNLFGGTPLHEAVRCGRVAAARRLLELGADRSAKDRDGKTPVELAPDSRAKEALERLFRETR